MAPDVLLSIVEYFDALPISFGSSLSSIALHGILALLVFLITKGSLKFYCAVAQLVGNQIPRSLLGQDQKAIHSSLEHKLSPLPPPPPFGKRGILRCILQASFQPRTVTIRRSFSNTKMSGVNILVYLLRRDLRLEDNPIFHELAKQKAPIYTHLLPLYVFSAQQIEVSGFLPKDAGVKSPYPEARSAIGGFWRCGPHRAKFLAESVWDLKMTLEEVGSGLEIRVGMVGEVIGNMLEGISKEKESNVKIGGVWMTEEEGREEKKEERDVRKSCEEAGIEFKLFTDEKYFIDEYVFLHFQHYMMLYLVGRFD